MLDALSSYVYAAPAEAPPVMDTDGKTWLLLMTEKLRAINRGEDGCIDTLSYLECMDCVAPIYESLFSTGFVVRQLQSDINGSCATVRKWYNTLPDGHGHTLQGIVEYGMKNVPREQLVSDPGSTVRGLLWLNRACAFIATFLQGLIEGKSSADAASTAYNTILKPYHTWITGKAVGTIMQYAPATEDILAKLRITEAQAKEQIRPFTDLMVPLCDEVRDFMTDMNANFPETV